MWNGKPWSWVQGQGPQTEVRVCVSRVFIDQPLQPDLQPLEPPSRSCISAMIFMASSRNWTLVSG